jgi:hypothetical protein
VIQRALERTGPLWPDLEVAYGQVWAVARILANEAELSGAGVRQAMETAVAGMKPQAGQSAWLQQALAEFRKVTASYWSGLFHCYEVAGLGRTNNDLEQFFGSWRWRALRGQIQARRVQFRLRRAFRRDPDKYLNELTARAIKLTLPPYFFFEASPARSAPGRSARG